GKDNENGARLAVEEINAKGLTIGGQKITLQLDPQDDAADPRQATQVAQKLVDDKVVAVVGHLNSGTSIPASKIYSDAGVVQISPSATNPAYTQQGFKTTYRVVATDAQQGPALADYAHSKGIKSVAVVDDSTAYGQGLAKRTTLALKDTQTQTRIDGCTGVVADPSGLDYYVVNYSDAAWSGLLTQINSSTDPVLLANLKSEAALLVANNLA
ncbi:branched-chain amino acid ABC transporter substrate-binding protein, partial [Staphylococcus lugdunensis]|nr:branched-chain amino acid ABC transporter substrate-binding protein [Staphylococcus lugdunensis]